MRAVTDEPMPCGCVGNNLCPQHESLLPLAERARRAQHRKIAQQQGQVTASK
jgi:hypothetical protein